MPTGSTADRPDEAALSAIGPVLREVFGDADVDELVPLTGGASRSTWRIRRGGDAFIVQRQRAASGREMAVEVAAVRAAAHAGVPVPEVVGFVDCAQARPAGNGESVLITRFVPGETIGPRIVRDDRFRAARASLVGEAARALASLHTVAPSAVAGIESFDPLDEYRARLEELAQPHPTFELAFRWLDEHRPAANPACVVHGDFRLGNLIVDEAGLAAVIDWELVHLGDPVEDLAWMCVPAWRFGSELPVAGMGERADLLAAYHDASGRDIDVEELRWWEVLCIVKWGVICVMQADAHRSGTVDSHELAAIGRRVCETEHDVFLALEGRW